MSEQKVSFSTLADMTQKKNAPISGNVTKEMQPRRKSSHKLAQLLPAQGACIQVALTTSIAYLLYHVHDVVDGKHAALVNIHIVAALVAQFVVALVAAEPLRPCVDYLFAELTA